MPSVPTPGKKEQSLPGPGPPTGPRPQGGWSCSSFAPAIRKLELTGLTAIVGSFCLFVGKRAVVLLVGLPATCGLFAWTSVNEIASAVAAVAARARQMASATKTSLRLISSSPQDRLSPRTLCEPLGLANVIRATRASGFDPSSASAARRSGRLDNAQFEPFDGKEGIDGSSPSEGFGFLPA